MNIKRGAQMENEHSFLLTETHGHVFFESVMLLAKLPEAVHPVVNPMNLYLFRIVH